MPKTVAVLGLGYGDEGKGVVTHLLTSTFYPNIPVCRFSGGGQAAHTVTLENGYKHTFSSFGSGTLNGLPTYLGEHFVIEPISLMKEYKKLVMDGFTPIMSIHPNCKITTPYDISKNQLIDYKNGTCGMGVGSTIDRSEKFYNLTYQCTFSDFIFKNRMELIKNYYKNLIFENDKLLDEFYNSINDMHKLFRMDTKGYKSVIYEGSQGLMLDQDIGFFPHVTRSKVDLTNIPVPDELYLVTRSYSTRHGFGPFEQYDLHLKNTENEFNVSNMWQGDFKVGLLNLDIIIYAINKTDKIRNHPIKHLVITCMDQLTEFKYIYKNKIISVENEWKFLNDIRDIMLYDHNFLDGIFINSPMGDYDYFF